jgi:hypothetical protein
MRSPAIVVVGLLLPPLLAGCAPQTASMSQPAAPMVQQAAPAPAQPAPMAQQATPAPAPTPMAAQKPAAPYVAKDTDKGGGGSGY